MVLTIKFNAMKTLKHLQPLIFVFLLHVSYAQITITSDDIVGVGDTLLQSYDSNIINFSPGGTGEQTWDFSSLTPVDDDTLIFINSADAPYGSAFPDADFAVKILEAQSGDTMFAYVDKSNTYLRVLGISSSDFNDIHYNPYENMMPFPVTYGDEFYSDYNAHVKFFTGTDSVLIKSYIKDTVLTDAYGTLILPLGSINTLRFYHKTYKTDSAFLQVSGNWQFSSVQQDTSYSYDWWTDDPLIKMKALELDVDAAGVVTDGNFISNAFIHSSGIRNDITLPEIIIETTNGLLKISNIPKEFKSIVICDISGKEIYSNTVNTGNISIYTNNFTNGVYILSFKSKNLVFSEKIIINR